MLDLGGACACCTLKSVRYPLSTMLTSPKAGLIGGMACSVAVKLEMRQYFLSYLDRQALLLLVAVNPSLHNVLLTRKLCPHKLLMPSYLAGGHLP